MRHAAAGRLLRLAWLLAVVVAVAVVLGDRWDEVRASVASLSAPALAGSAVAGLAGVGLSCGIWRALLGGLGSALPGRAAVRIFFVGQLGKYLPGSVWPAVAQMELGRDWAVPRRASAAAVVLFMWVHLVSGAIVAAAGLAAARAVPAPWALAAPVAGLLLLPAVIGPVIGWGLRLGRRPPLPRLPDARALSRAAMWAGAMWLAYGVHLLLLVRGVGADMGLVQAAGAFAASWCIGFLVVVAPAGAGAREAALVLTLPVLATSPALAVALASRLLLTVADAAWGALGLVVRTRPP